MHPRSLSLLALALLTAPALPARAQVAQKKTLTLDGARAVIAAAVAEARRNNAGGVIAVVDDGGNLMALERIDNTFAAGANISIGKARTAVLFKRPTRVFEDIIRNGRTPMIALADFTPLQGGVPILVDGEVVGGVGVSGASSAQQDEEFAIVGANALTGGMAAGMAGGEVSYFTRSEVTDAFARGAVLFDGGGNRNYMVHASHRTEAGQAEVHGQDTDIIYVIAGSATFVTGGSVVAPRTIAPQETRGTAIANGTTRSIAVGDVLIVPAGTPHWFQEVRGPFDYYVVKVR